ncbi:hypothetical protein R3P38DRAFT_3175276 [Favolaschia claudopus]|uniref:Uncharacterized protein n=1 Tax=Favolaschia claudopus TaxID=2862362 RepID=A0AAW0DCD5_9AGAR
MSTFPIKSTSISPLRCHGGGDTIPAAPTIQASELPNDLIDVWETDFSGARDCGGAPSRTRIIVQLFPGQDLKMKELDREQQRMVHRRELSFEKWKLARSVGAVFSSQCLREVLTKDGEEAQPCSECQSLLRLHTFQVAIQRGMPTEDNMKRVPKAYQDLEMGALFVQHRGLRELVELEDARSPWLKFAIGCVDRTFTSDTLTGMVKALVIEHNRLRLGKSLKNMSYDAEFSQFCDVLASTSPKAYETFRKQFGGPGLSSQQCARSSTFSSPSANYMVFLLGQNRAKMPRFEPDISAANISRARDVVDKLNYQGPLALSWDDTSLEAALSVYQKTKEACIIVGSVDGPINVKENDDLDELFAKAQLRKSDKVGAA